MSKQKRCGGTFEWAKHTDNCLKGCSHNCRYCYARYNAVTRFKQSTPDEWVAPRLLKNWDKKRKRLDGGVMFPTKHDILPRAISTCLSVIGQHLELGNRLLIVSNSNRKNSKHLKTINEKLLMGYTIKKNIMRYQRNLNQLCRNE